MQMLKKIMFLLSMDSRGGNVQKRERDRTRDFGKEGYIERKSIREKDRGGVRRKREFSVACAKMIMWEEERGHGHSLAGTVRTEKCCMSRYFFFPSVSLNDCRPGSRSDIIYRL